MGQAGCPRREEKHSESRTEEKPCLNKNQKGHPGRRRLTWALKEGKAKVAVCRDESEKTWSPSENAGDLSFKLFKK